MKRAVVAMSLAMLGSACMPLNTFYKENTPVDQLNRDLAQCRMEGLSAVPVDKDTRLIPGQELPRTLCDSAGHCRTYWVQVSPDRLETYDANATARAHYVEACMLQKGYEEVSLPACSASVSNAQAHAATKVMPPLNANSCAIKLNTGQWQVVTPGQ